MASITVPAVVPLERAGACTKFGVFLKDCAVWLGRQIKILWNSYLVPALVALGAFITTGFGVSTVFALLGFIATAIAHSKCCTSKTLRVYLYIVSACCFFASGYFFSRGSEVLGKINAIPPPLPAPAPATV